MTNISDTTLVMRPDELRLARELSVAKLDSTPRPRVRAGGVPGQGGLRRGRARVDSNSGRRVVIKFFNSRGGLDWSLLAREVEKLRYLFSDRHIIQLFAVGWDATPPYYVMDYMQGGSLEQLLRGRPLDMDHALAMFREIAVGRGPAWKGDHPLRPEAGQRPARSGRSSQAGRLRSVAASHEQGPPSAPCSTWRPSRPTSSRPRRAVGRLCPWRDLLSHAYWIDPISRRPGSGRRAQTGAAGGASRPLPAAASRAQAVSALSRPRGRRRAGGGRRPPPGVDPKVRFRDVGSVLHALDARATRLAQRPLLLLGGLGPLLVVVVIGAIAAYGISHLWTERVNS